MTNRALRGVTIATSTIALTLSLGGCETPPTGEAATGTSGAAADNRGIPAGDQTVQAWDDYVKERGLHLPPIDESAAPISDEQLAAKIGGDRTSTVDPEFEPVPETNFRDDPFGDPPIDWNAKRAARNGQPQFNEPSPPSTPSTQARPEDDGFRVRPLDPIEADEAAEDEKTTPRVPTTDPFDMLLVDMRKQLFQRSTWSDRPMREWITMSALSLVDEGIELHDGDLRDLSEKEREQVQAFHAFFEELRGTIAAPTSSSDALEDAIERLRIAVSDHPELKLPAAHLCWEVTGFADFEAFEPPRFLAGSEQEVILYLAIAGFTSIENDRGRWVTELSQQLLIFDDASGTVQWNDPWQSVPDECKTKRTDFFTTQRFRVPRLLSIGSYHLKVRVRDEQSGAEAEVGVPFEIVADPRRATPAK